MNPNGRDLEKVHRCATQKAQEFASITKARRGHEAILETFTYSSTTFPSQLSSAASLAYNSLKRVCNALAFLKHLAGNSDGKRVTGAGIANEPDGSRSLGMKDDPGRTVSPCWIDQFWILESRISLSGDDGFGGYWE